MGPRKSQSLDGHKHFKTKQINKSRTTSFKKGIDPANKRLNEIIRLQNIDLENYENLLARQVERGKTFDAKVTRLTEARGKPRY